MKDAGNERADQTLSLTYPEREVLNLMAQNKTYAEIATEMMLVPQTVYTIVKNIRVKFNLYSKQEPVNVAKEKKLI